MAGIEQEKLLEGFVGQFKTKFIAANVEATSSLQSKLNSEMNALVARLPVSKADLDVLLTSVYVQSQDLAPFRNFSFEISTILFFKTAQNLGLRCVFIEKQKKTHIGSQHLWW